MTGPLDNICWSMYEGCICGLEPGHDGDHECLSETHEPEHWTTEQGNEWLDKITKEARS